MAKTTIINNLPINLQSGSQTFGPANIPDGAMTITARFSRCTTATPTLWPNASTLLELTLQISLDGGTTWRDNNGISAIGGIVLKRDGTEAPESFMPQCDLPAGTNRKVRAAVSITNGPLVSILNAEVN